MSDTENTGSVPDEEGETFEEVPEPEEVEPDEEPTEE